MGKNNAAATLFVRKHHEKPASRRWTLDDQEVLRWHLISLNRFVPASSESCEADALRLVRRADDEWPLLLGPVDSPLWWDPVATPDAVQALDLDFFDLIDESFELARRAHLARWVARSGSLDPHRFLVGTATSPDGQVWTAHFPAPTGIEIVRPHWDLLVRDVTTIMNAWFDPVPSWLLAEPTNEDCRRCGHSHELHVPVFYDTHGRSEISAAEVSGACDAPGCEADCQRFLHAADSPLCRLHVVRPNVGAL